MPRKRHLGVAELLHSYACGPHPKQPGKPKSAMQERAGPDRRLQRRGRRAAPRSCGSELRRGGGELNKDHSSESGVASAPPRDLEGVVQVKDPEV